MYKNFIDGINRSLRHLLVIMVTTILIMMINFSIPASYSTSAIAASISAHQTISDLGTRAVTVYRSPDCSCCGNWLEHMKKHGFHIQADIKTDDIEAIKQQYNLPQDLASCHTAIIDGYVMEGHIPADDIKRFLQQQPQLAGLAVPGMTIGTPGMESGNTKEPFAVMEFNHQGEVQIFKKYL